MESVGKEASARRRQLRPTARSASIADQARGGGRRRAAGGAALGLGTIITAAATTVAADVTGILLASVVADRLLIIQPAATGQAMDEKISALRRRWPTRCAASSSGRRSAAPSASRRPCAVKPIH